MINRFENEYSDEYMVKWLNILRVMQENGISNNAANQLTQLIANFGRSATVLGGGGGDHEREGIGVYEYGIAFAQ